MIFKFYYLKSFILIVFIILISISSERKDITQNNIINKYSNNAKAQENKLIDENFFIIDSNNLEEISPHLYGYIISKNGILTDNFFKMIGHYEEPEPFGVYTMIRIINNNIIINQDYYGSYGLFLFENKNESYFALSNSFLLLVEYLYGNQNLTLNKDLSDQFLAYGIIALSIYETMIKEIAQLPSNALLSISIKKKIISISYIQNKENTIPLESKEGLAIIDKWFDKWGYILRSLKKKTNEISFDLSGGFDSRLALSILLNSGINITEILITSRSDNPKVYGEDFKIASKISSEIGFKLNNKKFDNNCINWNVKDSLASIFYTKLGFTKNLNSINSKFWLKPKFLFNGNGGESIRGIPGCEIEKYIEILALKGSHVNGHQEEFYNSSMRLLNRSVELLKSEKSSYNGYDIAKLFYQITNTKYHLGKYSIGEFLSNRYSVSPLSDPELNQIKYDISENSTQDLIAYIYTRFAPKLTLFPFEKNRELRPESLQKAKNLNKKIPKYQIKFDYNKNFYIDTKRKSPVPESYDNWKNTSYIYEIIESSEFRQTFYKVYDKNAYDWILKYKNKEKFPYRRPFGLLSIGEIIKYI